MTHSKTSQFTWIDFSNPHGSVSVSISFFCSFVHRRHLSSVWCVVPVFLPIIKYFNGHCEEGLEMKMKTRLIIRRQASLYGKDVDHMPAQTSLTMTNLLILNRETSLLLSLAFPEPFIITRLKHIIPAVWNDSNTFKSLCLTRIHKTTSNFWFFFLVCFADIELEEK